MKNLTRLIIQIIIGIIFLISGIFKALNSQGFSSLINAYGFGWVGVLGPLVSTVEIVLGLCLILNIQPKITTLLTALITTIFTILYSYAYFVRGIEDCGCMGPLVTTPPYISFMRNIVIIVGSLWIFFNFRELNIQTKNWKKWIVYAVGGLFLYISGYTLSNPLLERVNKIQTGDQVNNTVFKYFSDKISTDTCIIFVFRTECTHCWNVTENIKSIKRTPGFNKVYGITYADSDTSEYMNTMQPNFEILKYPNDELYEYIISVPVLLILKDGKIIKKLDGNDIPCGPMLRKMLE